MKNTDIENSPKAAGKRELLAHNAGKPITRMQAMAAKCFECCNGFKDGRVDCRIHHCPLYPWMPYAKVSDDSQAEAEFLSA